MFHPTLAAANEAHDTLHTGILSHLALSAGHRYARDRACDISVFYSDVDTYTVMMGFINDDGGLACVPANWTTDRNHPLYHAGAPIRYDGNDPTWSRPSRVTLG
jgi:hypothetical protein